MKIKTLFICSNCTFTSPKWLGKCPACDQWNTFQEETIQTQTSSKKKIDAKPKETTPISQIPKETKRIKTNIQELDRVLGEGIVNGSVLLLGGEPGIGKSTLTLQICGSLADQAEKIIYISGEESISQISLRAHRIQIIPENLKLLNNTNLEEILATLYMEKPNFAIIDSIQVIESQNIPGYAGTINQVRYCTEGLTNFAKETNTPILIIGHVTKEGNLAGPRVLEHLVDTVLQLEGDRYQNLRILRSQKNRFGSTNEVGIFEMKEKGLQEVKNPSASFLEERQKNAIGSCITCIIEGTRPLLVEVQALTNLTPFGYPKRTASGFDVNRLQLLIAVLQRHAGINLSNQDVYITTIGGIKLTEPAADLAVCLAIISSYKKKPLPENLTAIGEVDLTGQIRKVSQIEKRQKEVSKMNLATIKLKEAHIKTLLQQIL